MESLKEFITNTINEALRDDKGSELRLTAIGLGKKSKGDAAKIQEIKDWIDANYKAKKISVVYNKEYDTYIANAPYGVSLVDSNLKELTNGEFIWGKVSWFNVENCNKLVNFIGGPIVYDESCSINNCDSFTSLEGLQQSEFHRYGKHSLLSIENNKNLKSYEFLPETGLNTLKWNNNGIKLSKADKKLLSKKSGHDIKNIYADSIK
jgi:hypothetical protein